MISNQILQNTIEGIKNICKFELAILGIDGQSLVSTFPETEISRSVILNFAESQADAQSIREFQFFKVYDEQQLEYILVVKGASEEAYTIGRMAVFQLQTLLTAYKEKFDRDNFIKNLLLDNLLLIDIYNQARKLHVDVDAQRIVYILECPAERDPGVQAAVAQALGNSSENFITAVDEQNIIVVRQVGDNEKTEDIRATAELILQASGLENDGMTRVAYGTIVTGLQGVSRSYKEAQMALDVGKIFYEDSFVIAYSSLGIGRLIYQLPIPLCKMFIKEIFAGKSPDDFDEETLTTIYKFFENNLNVSETSRQLYIHRNTLVYRLDKLQRLTGLDLRVFEDAITFKIALMVAKHMKYMEQMDT